MGSWDQEMWNCPYSNSSFPTYAEDIDAGIKDSPSLAMLSEVAREKNVTIVGGSIPERSDGKLYNTCCVLDKNGELKAKFQKVKITYNVVCQPSQVSCLGEGPQKHQKEAV